jgi:hypothetical protein
MKLHRKKDFIGIKRNLNVYHELQNVELLLWNQVLYDEV